MHLLIKSALIVQEKSAYHNQRVDVRIEKGVIAEIGQGLALNGAQCIEGADLWLSAGFVDTYAFFRDPGFEYKEDLNSGCDAAFAGGFTRVLLQPDTHPVIQSKGEVQSVLSKTAQAAPQIMVAGALTEDLLGKDITEMLDMHQAGAIAFSNADHAIQDTSALMRALQYAQHCGSLVMCLPSDAYLSHKGQVHEGEVSTRLGLKGIPALAEEMQIIRDLALLEYTGGRLHFSKISAARSVALIREAKKKGLAVSCGVAAHHLYLTDEVLPGFNTDYKLNPPLRTALDRKALLAGVMDGTIDVICSDHQPEDIEHKFIEFDHARPGIAGLETALAVVFAACDMEEEKKAALEALSAKPAALLGQPTQAIAPGAVAELVVFDAGANQRLQSTDLKTKGINNPFINTALPAPIRLVVRHQHQLLNHAK